MVEVAVVFVKGDDERGLLPHVGVVAQGIEKPVDEVRGRARRGRRGVLALVGGRDQPGHGGQCILFDVARHPVRQRPRLRAVERPVEDVPLVVGEFA